MDYVAGTVIDILACYSKLCKFPDVEPSPEINDAFGKLVSLCSKTPDEASSWKVLTDPSIVSISPHLRQLCADGEYYLEMQWAEKIGACESLQKGIVS
ncbi:hypothetical protein ACLMJK_008092 [Lecanora helva]